MARQNQPSEGLDEREIAIADGADMFIVQGLEKGRWAKRMFRTFAEAHSAAMMSPDPKARIAAQSAAGEKVEIDRKDWPRWLAHLSAEK
jgi:hypothetical protein